VASQKVDDHIREPGLFPDSIVAMSENKKKNMGVSGNGA
jgi:hypothetical protein